MDGAAITRPHHADHMRKGRDVVFDGHHLLPDVAPRQIPQGHQYTGTGRPADIPDRGRLQQGIDGVDDAGRFGAPEHAVRLGNVGQQVSHHVAWSDSQVVEHIGAAADVVHQVFIGDLDRLIPGVAVHQETDGHRLRINRGPFFKNVKGV